MTNLADKIDALAEAMNVGTKGLGPDSAFVRSMELKDLLIANIPTLTRALRDAERMREALEFVWPATLVLQGMCQRIGCALGADKAAEMEVVIRQALGDNT